MFFVRFHPPADVVNAERHGEQGDVVVEDVPWQSFETAGRRVAADADVEEPHIAIGEPQQRVVLDVLPISPGGRDAVTQERHRITVPNRKVVGPAASASQKHHTEPPDPGEPQTKRSKHHEFP